MTSSLGGHYCEYAAFACLDTVALRFWRALRASVLYGTEVRKAQKFFGDTVWKDFARGGGRAVCFLKVVRGLYACTHKCAPAGECRVPPT